MRLETFHGRTFEALLAKARRAVGPDGLILGTRRTGPEGAMELVAVTGTDLEILRRRLEDPDPVRGSRPSGETRIRPRVVALVGPPGAGKTSTAVKLALHARGFGQLEVGLISLDTYRVGALEEIQTFAEISGLPLEVVYHRRDVEPAMRRLRERDVILVDTPGRWSEGRRPDEAAWIRVLEELDPDEVHLVVPGWAPPEWIAARGKEASAVGATHGLLTQLDRAADTVSVLEAAEAVGLPLRWVADGPELPGDLATARARILGVVGEDRRVREPRAG